MYLLKTDSHSGAVSRVKLTPGLFRDLLRFTYAGSPARLAEWIRSGDTFHTSFASYRKAGYVSDATRKPAHPDFKGQALSGIGRYVTRKSQGLVTRETIAHERSHADALFSPNWRAVITRDPEWPFITANTPCDWPE